MPRLLLRNSITLFCLTNFNENFQEQARKAGVTPTTPIPLATAALDKMEQLARHSGILSCRDPAHKVPLMTELKPEILALMDPTPNTHAALAGQAASASTITPQMPRTTKFLTIAPSLRPTFIRLDIDGHLRACQMQFPEGYASVNAGVTHFYSRDSCASLGDYDPMAALYFSPSNKNQTKAAVTTTSTATTTTSQAKK